MTNLTAVSRQILADKSWTRFTSYSFASKDNLALPASAEIAKVVHFFPIAFVKQQDSFLLIAVLSLTLGTNLFVAPDGRWLGGYVASFFRGYPFQLAKPEGKDDLILCVDEDSGLVNEDKAAGEPFYDDNGDVSQPVKKVMNFLNQVEQNRAATNLAVAALAEAYVITDWPLKIQDGDEEKPVTGLYRIDETKLNALDDEAFLTLRSAGSLPLAYAQLLSMGNIAVLQKLAAHRKSTASPSEPADIQDLFGEDDGTMIG